MATALEAEIMARVEQEKLAVEGQTTPDTGTRTRTRKTSTKDTDKVYDEIKIHRQENIDFQTSVKTELRKQRD